MRWYFWKRWGRYGNRLSMKGRIGLGIAASRLIFLPVITLAIYYIANMKDAANRIAYHEVKTARFADQAVQDITEIRKSERDFLLLKDPVHLKEIDDKGQKLLQQIEGGLLENNQLIDAGERAKFETFHSQVKHYLNHIQSLTQTIGPSPSIANFPQFPEMVASYQKLVNSMLEAAKSSRSPDEINRSIVVISNPDLSFDRFVIQTLIGSDANRAGLYKELQAQGTQLEFLARQISQTRWKKVESERTKIEELGDRATLLITVTLVLTLVVSFSFTWYLPRRVLNPLRQITQALRSASSGNYDVFLHLSAKDELGEMVNEFHNLIEHMRDQKNGKTLSNDSGSNGSAPSNGGVPTNGSSKKDTSSEVTTPTPTFTTF
jgi:HAMP domain-containing protein